MSSGEIGRRRSRRECFMLGETAMLRIELGDSFEVLKTIEDNFVDAVVTDPPYGWRFMGKAWDGPDIEKTIRNKARAGEHFEKDRKRIGKAQSAGLYDQSLQGNLAFMEWTKAWATEALRVLKPGGHALIFCGPRTYHAMVMGVELAGFEIRDQLQWIFGTGFPKSKNLKDDWQGFGTALKPANEPIVLARKPLSEKTVAYNVIKWGTGALNIDGCRIEGTKPKGSGSASSFVAKKHDDYDAEALSLQGRWPANLILDEEAAKLLDEQSGTLTSGKPGVRNKKWSGYAKGLGKLKKESGFGDSGGASRFFYVAKASKRERNEGLEGMTEKHSIPQMHTMSDPRMDRPQERRPSANHHPTVKPIKLMRYLCRLITPPGGVVLDPFMGSGSTGIAALNEGFGFCGIEMETEYCDIAKARLKYTKKKLKESYKEQ